MAYNNDKELEQLDNEFNELLVKLESNKIRYSFREKYIKTEWLKKLKLTNSSLEEIKLRNRFINHFVRNQEANINVFRFDPFNRIPEGFGGPLKDLKKLLPRDPDEALNPTEDEKRSYIKDLFDSLVDEGNFLSQLPVPRNGCFFIQILKSDDEVLECL